MFSDEPMKSAVLFQWCHFLITLPGTNEIDGPGQDMLYLLTIDFQRTVCFREGIFCGATLEEKGFPKNQWIFCGA